MNTHGGYSKKTLTDVSVLLAGGGDKPFEDFIGSIQYNSTSKTLQYRIPYSDPQNPPSWLNIVTLGARAFDDTTYVTAVGNGSGNYINQLYYTKNGSNSYFTVNYATNADKLDGYHATDLYIRNTHMYGLENLCIDVYDGGQTTKVDYKTITTSGTKSDTYFYVKTSENLVDGQIYSFGWYVTGYTGSATWTFYASNNSTCIPIHINKNGWVFGTGKMIVSGAAASNNILIDDAGSSNALALTFTNFVIVKGDIFPYYTVPISKMSVAYATNADNADTVDGYHANDFATSEHSHGLTNSNFFKSLPTTSGNLTWKEAFGYNPKGALLMSVRIDSPAPSWCVGNYGSGILYGGGDTKGFMSSAYSSPYVMWAGGNGTTDSATPVWTMSISGANGGSYNLANFLTSQDHYKTSVTAGTAGTSSATSGSTLSVPYVTVNANGHVTGYGTHTHTISGFLTTLDHYKTSITAGTAGTSSDTSGATLAVPYISMNANGHVTDYGTHTHSVTAVVGSYTSNGGQQNPNYFGTNRVGFLMMNTTVNNNSLYKDWVIMDCYGGNDVGGGVAIGVNRQSLGAYIMRSAAARTSWAESAELIGTHNYTTYCATSSHQHYIGTTQTQSSGATQNLTGIGNITLVDNQAYHIYFPNDGDYTHFYTGGTNEHFSIGYGRIQGYSNIFINADTDGSQSEYILMTAGHGVSATTSHGLKIGYDSLTWKDNTIWHAGNDGSGSGLDADLLDGYNFSDLESRYVNVTGDIMTGGILMSSMEASGKRWMYGVTRNSGFKYDYAGNESFIISSGTYSNSSISFYTSNRLSMNDSTGQWNSVTPDMRIKGTQVSINSDINTSYQLYVNGSTYSTGYYRANSSDSYILLGGGGHKLITDLISNGNYECLAYYSTSTKISSANSLKYTSDPGYLTVGNEAWISGNCIGFIDGMNIRFYDDSNDADPTDFPYIHDNISLFGGEYATIFDAYQPIVVSNDIRLVDPTNYSWKDLYANNGTFKGTLKANSGTFTGTLNALNNKFYVNSSGAFWTSDIRAKKDIHQITKEEVDKLFSTPDGYLKGFTFKDGDIKSFGVIAQEIIEYCPECIDEGELLHVNYDVALSKIMAGMYLKIKELEKEIEILRNR